jgi:hypothetical protein
MSGIINSVGSKSGIIGQTTSGSGLQSAFFATMSGNQNNIASMVTYNFDTTIRNIGNDFNTTSKTYTAPVTGIYQFNVCMYMMNVDADHQYHRPVLSTSNRSYGGSIIDTRGFDQTLVYFYQNIGVACEMDAGDIAYVYHNFNLGSATTDIIDASFFTGYFTGITY